MSLNLQMCYRRQASLINLTLISSRPDNFIIRQCTDLILSLIFSLRKFSDAQKEMQGLRTRLTLAETKLVEKEAEILALKEENFGLKEALEKISQQQQQAALNKSDSK